MSGGALDYVCFRLDDPIAAINDRINKNGKTLQQIWDEKSEDEKKNAIEWGHDWEIPWNKKNVPDNVRLIAEEEAWKKCKGVKVAPSFISLAPFGSAVGCLGFVEGLSCARSWALVVTATGSRASPLIYTTKVRNIFITTKYLRTFFHVFL